VRTNTLVKNAVVQIDATPFRQWYKKHYGLELTKHAEKDKNAKKAPEATEVAEAEKVTKSKAKLFKKRIAGIKPVPQNLLDQFSAGRLLAVISSRPGQHGRADGYILEGPELDFYLRKLKRK
jgi:small subunit ribosomal protein S8e